MSTTAEDSYRQVVSKWMSDNSWPPSSSTGATLSEDDYDPKAILVITETSEPGDIFKFTSGFGYFEVTALHYATSGLLDQIQVALVAPGYTKQTPLVRSVSGYELTTAPGKELQFDLDGLGIIAGNVSFQYVTKGNMKSVAMAYNIEVPFAGQLEDTVSLSPAELTPESGFPAEKLKAIPGLSKVGSDAYSISKMEDSDAREQKCKSYPVTVLRYTDHSLVLLQFLHDFVRDHDKVVVETYYSGSDQLSSPTSTQDTISISFLSIFDLVGSIEPSTLTVAAGLFVRIPIAGRVRIANIQGSLSDGASVTAEIDVVVAKGVATLTAKENGQGKHDLYVDLSLTIKFVGTIRSGEYRLLTLPF